MNHSVMRAFAPKVTRMIRLDHAHLMSVFHRYTADAPAHTRQALADRICIALELHAKLEEEVFYPALRELFPDGELVQKSVPEHQEMRRLIARLRRMSAQHIGFDGVVLELMRCFIHHMADEETVLLPAAERVLSEYLGELGARMTRRRFELARPRVGAIASSMVRAMPRSTLAMMAAAFGIGLLVAGLGRRRGDR